MWYALKINRQRLGRLGEFLWLLWTLTLLNQLYIAGFIYVNEMYDS